MNGRYTASFTELTKGGCLAANSNTFCCFSSSSSNVRGSGDAVGTRGPKCKCRSVSNPFRVLPSSRLGVSVTRWKHGKNIFFFFFLLLGLLYRSLFDLSCKVNSSKLGHLKVPSIRFFQIDRSSFSVAENTMLPS